MAATLKECSKQRSIINSLVSDESKLSEIYQMMCDPIYHPSARAGYDTRSIFFKRSLTGFNSEFSFS